MTATVTCRSTRSRTASENIKINVCIIYNFKTHKSDSKIYKISDVKRAEQFLEITRYYEDNVFYRCSHLLYVKDIIDGGIYYHKSCLRAYELKYKADLQVVEKTVQQAVQENNDENCKDMQSLENHSIDKYFQRIKTM